MDGNYSVTITNGEGTVTIPNGAYSAAVTTTGYDNTSLDPSSVTIVDDTEVYEFTVEANGTLTLHVSEEGTIGGTAIVGAKFIRCDSAGNTYGTEITTNEQGNALFENVPYAADGSPIIYYKQTSSDGSHNFDGTLKNITLTSQTYTAEVQNTLPVEKTIKLTDKNYGLPIESASISLS